MVGREFFLSGCSSFPVPKHFLMFGFGLIYFFCIFILLFMYFGLYLFMYFGLYTKGKNTQVLGRVY